MSLRDRRWLSNEASMNAYQSRLFRTDIPTPVELNFSIVWSGIGGYDAALLQRRTVSGMDAPPIEVDYARSWVDLVELLEWEAEVAIYSTEGSETGVF